MAIYLIYEGIKGNVTADGYKDHIQISSLQFGVGRGVSMEPGNLANREATRPSISEVTITKAADNSVTDFFVSQWWVLPVKRRNLNSCKPALTKLLST